MKNIGVTSLCLFTIICSILVGASTSRAEGSLVTLLGVFSRVDSGDGGEHCRGYDVELWNSSGSITG